MRLQTQMKVLVIMNDETLLAEFSLTESLLSIKVISKPVSYYFYLDLFQYYAFPIPRNAGIMFRQIQLKAAKQECECSNKDSFRFKGINHMENLFLLTLMTQVLKKKPEQKSPQVYKISRIKNFYQSRVYCGKIKEGDLLFYKKIGRNDVDKLENFDRVGLAFKDKQQIKVIWGDSQQKCIKKGRWTPEFDSILGIRRFSSQKDFIQKQARPKIISFFDNLVKCQYGLFQFNLFRESICNNQSAIFNKVLQNQCQLVFSAGRLITFILQKLRLMNREITSKLSIEKLESIRLQSYLSLEYFYYTNDCY